ncbi:hypothetical protein FI667_g1407, partial [Globisporangium splendens]
MNPYVYQYPSTPQATQQYFSIAHEIQTKSTNPQATCCYPSKPCMNPRVVKRDGNLHRFCQFHRAKANKNQRALQRRRLADQMVEQLPIDECMLQQSEQYDLFVKEELRAKTVKVCVLEVAMANSRTRREKRQQKLTEQHQHGTITPNYYLRHLNECLVQHHQDEDTLEFQSDCYFEKSEVEYFSEEDLRVLEVLLFKKEDSNSDNMLGQ